MIAESLAGKRIAITGATGFVGTALVERLLRCVPDCELVLLVRDSKRTPAATRIQKELLKNDAFDRLRASLSGNGEGKGDGETFQQMTDRRITTVTGDVSTDGLGLNTADRALFATADVVIHSAATVSFDSPLTSAVEINLLGPTRIAQLCNELAITPHLVAVSTCYVAGNRRGSAPEQLVSEGPFDIGLDWHAEVAASRRLKGDTEAASRTPAQLGEFRKHARAELGAAGAPALAAKTEQLRSRWVKDQLVQAGRSRAASVGWPDAYAFTKALGEQALFESKGDVPVSIVRPSIIESAWAEPRPGWIRGFRMAEPVIISYARGLLREFPGVPEGTVDVIPVDMVVAAIIAVAAAGPERAPFITQVASGDINPLKYRTLVDNVSGFFTRNPIYDPEGQPILVPEWRFPGRGRVQSQLTRAKQVIGGAERVLQTLPLRGKQAEISATLETRRMEVERALEYVELYGLYTECEAIYQVDNLLALWDQLSPGDQATFEFDPRHVDWVRYVNEIHLPSILQHARVKTTPGKSRTPDRMQRLRQQVLDPKRHVAAFDLENTLIASNVVESYSFLATRRLNGPERARYVARTLVEAPGLLKLDKRDRTDFLRHFYRRYEDAPVAQIEEDALEMMTQLILTKSFPEGLRRVREHKAAGHHTILITGALSFNVAGLRPLFDEIVAAEMSVRPDGTYSGEMTTVPPTGEARAQILADYCEAGGFRLDECVAYADSSSDLPLFEAVGYPVAVNPETRLAAIARKRGWLVEQWSKASGASRPLLPIGPMMVERETPEGLLMRALQVRRSPAKFGMARIASSVAPVTAAKIGPLEYRSIDDPACPGPGWHRVRTRLAGICGSDLALVEGHASQYFDEYVSFPFVPGHEIVGELDDATRVVIEPVLGHAARGFAPPFEGAAPGDGDDYAHLVTGHLEPGIQTGFCCSTGGGWAPWFWAHDSQIHRIPDDMADERAVLVEPLAGGIHAALLAWPAIEHVTDPIVAVLGAGTMGLAAIAGLRRYIPNAQIVVGARYPHQIALATALGSHTVVQATKLDRAVRRAAGCHLIGDTLSSGAHVTIDAVGTSASITDALRITRPRGRVVLLGMPADVRLDLTGLWHRETELKGAYTYGTETLPDGTRARTFDLALSTAGELGVERMLSATYRLDEHVDAIAHAAAAGRRGAVKIAFDMRERFI